MIKMMTVMIIMTMILLLLLLLLLLMMMMMIFFFSKYKAYQETMLSFFQIKIPVVSPSGGCQVDLLIPLSGGESPSQQTGKNENPVEGGNIQPTADAAEGGAKELEEGAKAMTPPPDYGRDVTFQRSLSGEYD